MGFLEHFSPFSVLKQESLSIWMLSCKPTNRVLPAPPRGPGMELETLNSDPRTLAGS